MLGKCSLTSLGASRTSIYWPPRLERGLTSIDGLLQQNPLKLKASERHPRGEIALNQRYIYLLPGRDALSKE